MLISHTDDTNGNNGFNATATPATPPVNVFLDETKEKSWKSSLSLQHFFCGLCNQIK